ncbi:MAG: ureidoglycolate lyase, partial [Anaerolineae bacterium]|nr:ureidoglycolate lyase [Anaerolineae bacterium]
MPQYRLQVITAEGFAPFGTVVDWGTELEQTGRPFHILMRSEAPTGWRLAVSRVTVRQIELIAHHPDTAELFAPIAGRCALVVAPRGPFREEAVEVFFLDRPVCVAAGVWHGTFALSEAGTLLIAENLEVSSEAAAL